MASNSKEYPIALCNRNASRCTGIRLEFLGYVLQLALHVGTQLRVHFIR